MRHRLYWLFWLVIGFGAYELWAVTNSTPGDTLSEAVWDVLTVPHLGPALTAIVLGLMLWLVWHWIAPAVYYHWRNWRDRHEDRD